MSKFIWLPEHCEQLRSLRIAAGIDISTLASNHSLSKMQIKQLEEGGESAFYTPEIKFTVGRKLIRSFGVEVVHIEPKEEAIESDLFAVVAELPAPLAEGVAHTKLTKILESFNFRGSINYFYLICFGVTLIALFFFLGQRPDSMKEDLGKQINAPHTE
jgi:transcriptional regulator with XRE-family HTH domain